jgi:very-short-patch-repair endonuclease
LREGGARRRRRWEGERFQRFRVKLNGAAHDGDEYDARHTETLGLFGYIVLTFRNDRSWPIRGETANDILAVRRLERV